MAAFLLTWLSYFLILTIVFYVWASFTMKSAAPGAVFAVVYFTGGLPFFGILILSTIFAAISKFDPLGWLWAMIAHAVATNPHPV